MDLNKFWYLAPQLVSHVICSQSNRVDLYIWNIAYKVDVENKLTFPLPYHDTYRSVSLVPSKSKAKMNQSNEAQFDL